MLQMRTVRGGNGRHHALPLGSLVSPGSPHSHGSHGRDPLLYMQYIWEKAIAKSIQASSCRKCKPAGKQTVLISKMWRIFEHNFYIVIPKHVDGDGWLTAHTKNQQQKLPSNMNALLRTRRQAVEKSLPKEKKRQVMIV